MRKRKRGKNEDAVRFESSGVLFPLFSSSPEAIMWAEIKGWLATFWRPPPAAARRVPAGARITAVSVDPMRCLAHEWCAHVCPQVFEIELACARVRPGAAEYFTSHETQILRAEDECPTQAIRVTVEGP
jgi:ferredoxin